MSEHAVRKHSHTERKHSHTEHVRFPDEVSKAVDDDETHDIHGGHHDAPNTVNFGLLSIHHIYATTHVFPKGGVIVSASKHPELTVAIDHSAEVRAHETPIKIELKAEREGKFSASFQVTSGTEVTHISVVATIMGKNKGTPALRPGVHCVGRDPQADSEYESDWKGFNKK
eukprot:Opistho-1_new@47849